MRFFSTAVYVALAAYASLVSAQVSTKGNAITHPVAGESITAGKPYTIEWMNTVGSSVTLVVMSGPANQLEVVYTITTNAPNTGSFVWNVPEDLAANSGYAIRISYDQNPNNFNYSDRFVFISSVTATPTRSTARSTSTASSTETESSTFTESVTSTETSETTATSTQSNTSTVTSASTTVSTSTRRTSGTSASSTPSSTGAPPSAANSNLSSPIAVIMAVLAATLFLH